MHVVRLICSDRACAHEGEVVVATLPEADVEICPSCGCGMQVLGVRWEERATIAMLHVLRTERDQLEQLPPLAA